MSNIRPVGLKGQQTIDRMKDLMGKTTLSENKISSTVEMTKLAPDNKVYGIIRENHEYYIKTSNKIDNLKLEDFQYIGGLGNKKDFAYPSYAKALKKLNLKMISLNEIYEGNLINVFENDNLYDKDVVEEEEEVVVENDFVEEDVDDKVTTSQTEDGVYVSGSRHDCENGMKTEGELKVKPINDGPKDLDGNSIGDYEDVTDDADKAPNDKSTGTEKEGPTEATPKKTIKENKKPRFSILTAMKNMDSLVESLSKKKNNVLNELDMDYEDAQTMSQKYAENMESKVQPIEVTYFDFQGNPESNETYQPKVHNALNSNYDKSSVGQSDSSLSIDWTGRARSGSYIGLSGWEGNVTLSFKIGNSTRLSKEGTQHVIMLAEMLGEIFDCKIDAFRLTDLFNKKGSGKLKFGANGHMGESTKKKSLIETKYKLKIDDPSPEPVMGGDEAIDDFPSDEQVPEPDMGGMEDMGGEAPVGDDKPFDDTPFDAGVEANEEQDPRKFIEQLSGKIGQSLRKYSEDNGTDFDLEKSAINSVIAGTHAAEMEEEDIDDIISKLKSAGNAGGDNENNGEMDTTGASEPQGDPSNQTGGETGGAEGGGGMGIGENFETLPKEHKQVFKNAKLNVSDEDLAPGSIKENYNEMNSFDDLERLEREVSNRFSQYSDEEIVDEDEIINKSEPLSNNPEKDMFDDNSDIDSDLNDRIKDMIQQYMTSQNGFNEETVEPVVKPTTTPAPTKIPRRRQPYRVKPNVNPRPKANN